MLAKGGLVLLIVISTWVAVVAYWLKIDHEPSSLQMGLWLGVFPVTLAASLLLVLRQTSVAGKQTGATSTDGVAESESITATAVDAHRSYVQSSTVQLPAGCDTPAALTHLASSLPTLHATLKTHAGLPARVAEVKGLAVDAMREQLLRYLEQRDRSMLDVAHVRALVLLNPVVDRLLAQAHIALSAATAAGGAAPTQLQMDVLLPLRWPEVIRQMAERWLYDRLTACGLPMAQFHIVSVALASDLQTWRHLSQVSQRSPCPAASSWHLLVAADSWISERGLTQWEVSAKDQQTHGVPGEGAAGVLLRSGHCAMEELPAIWMSILHESPFSPTSNRAEAARLSGKVLHQAMAAAGLASDAIAGVMSDAGKRPDHVIEATSAAAQVMPDLDSERCIHLGWSCGDLGVAMPIALLALAAGKVEQEQRPVLALGMRAEPVRLAVAMVPAESVA
jgi:hypothetical protein